MFSSMFQPTKKWDLKVCFKAEVDQIISYKTPRIYRKHNFVILLISQQIENFPKEKNNNSVNLWEGKWNDIICPTIQKQSC